MTHTPALGEALPLNRHVIVTRPSAQALEWQRDLQARGVDALVLPLIGIEPPRDTAALQHCWRQLPTYRLVVFVSPNAAQQFLALRPVGMAWPAATQCGSPGPGTSQALVQRGVPSACIIEPAVDAAQFDSESLWEQLARHDWRGAAVLIVRGEGGRDWLADTLRQHGAQVDHVQAYQRTVPVLDDTQHALLRLAMDNPARYLWLFSSSEAISNLAGLAPACGAVDWAGVHAIATHPRIAERARALGMTHVVVASPRLDAVVACIQSARP